MLENVRQCLFGNMKRSKTIHLDDFEVADLLQDKWHQVIESVEAVFTYPHTDMVPKVYLPAGKAGDYRAMPAAMGGYAALKWIGVFPNNKKYDLPTTIGTLILSDRYTGQTLATMDCSTLTAYRTAATSAIAAKYCAPEAREFAFIGCGKQAKYHIEAYESVFSHMRMIVETYDKDKNAEKVLHDWIHEENIALGWGKNDSVEKAVKNADVVTTLTPSTKPYLDFKYLKENCHVNAVGGDAKGKRELLSNVIGEAENIICDDPEQAFHSGELQYSDEWGHIRPGCSIVYSLRDLIKNKKTVKPEEGVSVFDSTGVALEDIAIAELIYRLYYS